MAGYKPNQLKNKSFDDIQKLFEKSMKRESAKKQKGHDDTEEAKLKDCMKIVSDEEEVAIDAIPLATKPPSIVDWKIHKEGQTSYYQITRADGSSKMYLVFSQLLKSFDREDLETLWMLVKAEHGYTRPKEGYERVLWGDLKIMFEPHVEDAEINIKFRGGLLGFKVILTLLVTAAQDQVSTASTRDFWYTAEVDDATKYISFSLSLFENQLSFTRFDFLIAIGLTDSKTVVPLPPKGTVRVGLATLGLTDKDKPSLTSTELGSHDQMNLSQQTIAYCLIFGLEINIGEIIFNDLIHKLQNGKKNREPNVCYTRFISLILEQLLGGNYMMNLLLSQKGVFDPPSGEVIAKESADKSQFGTNVQPLSQPKAPTTKKPKKKKISSSTQPKSLEASVTAECKTTSLKPLIPQSPANLLEGPTPKYHILIWPRSLPKKIVEKEEITEEQTLEIPTVAQLLDEVNKEAQETPESPYDTESVSGFEVADSDDTHDNNVSHSTHISHDIASAERLSLPDHLDHICKEVSSLHSRLGNINCLEQLLKIPPYSYPREPTSPRDKSKGKGIANEEPPKDIMPFIEEGGSAPKIPNLKSFILLEGTLSQENLMAKLKEMKRLFDLKEQEKKSEEELKKILNSANSYSEPNQS
ncbi:hypothetical protein Tco_0129034 [Tanacetum coccineum]